MLKVGFHQAEGDLAGLCPVPIDEDLPGPAVRLAGEVEGPVEVQRGAHPVGQAQGVLLTQVPEGLTLGEGSGLALGVLRCQARPGFGDPGGFLGYDCFNLGLGGGFGGTHDQPAVGGDLQAEGLPV